MLGSGAGRDSPSSALRPAQVGQYVSRAEELKAIISSSRALQRQGTSARDLLKGGPGFWPGTLAASLQPAAGGTLGWPS